MKTFHQFLNEMISKEGKFYFVRSKKGKNLGKFRIRSDAVRRLRQVEWFKHHKT